MTRSEMLTELKEIANTAVMSGQWRDSLLLSLLAEGQDKFCEDTGFFIDRTNYTITLATDTANYAISDRIIQILGIWYGTTKLGKFEERDRGDMQIPWFPYTESSPTGMPSCWQTDRDSGYITFYPVPTSAENGRVLTLQVWRYSRYALDVTGKEPEIPSRFHRACLDWAAFRCFSMHDAESFDPQEANRHLELYNYYVKQGQLAFRHLAGIETSVGMDPAYRT